ncbi:MAG TPA: hypothetical protein VM452_03225 [Caulifigura sp.]|jgi:hypothetical protein|nr:hypothetical protein [Caulifigura sp.]
MTYFENSDVTYWTALGLGVLFVGGFAAVKVMGPERVRPSVRRLHAAWRSDAGGRILGLLLYLASVYLFWALLIVPVQKTIREGRGLVMVAMSGIVFLSILMQIGLIALVCGSRKGTFLKQERDGELTPLQSATAAVMLGVGFLVLFGFIRWFGLRPW